MSYTHNETNCVRFIGDVVLEPKALHSKNGNKFQRFVVNVTEYQNGKEYQNAFPVHCYSEYADNLKIADTVLVVGRLRNRRWLNENGNTSYYVYVLAECVKIIKDNRQVNLYNDREIYDLINDFNENFNEM